MRLQEQSQQRYGGEDASNLNVLLINPRVQESIAVLAMAESTSKENPDGKCECDMDQVHHRVGDRLRVHEVDYVMASRRPHLTSTAHNRQHQRRLCVIEPQTKEPS